MRNFLPAFLLAASTSHAAIHPDIPHYDRRYTAAIITSSNVELAADAISIQTSFNNQFRMATLKTQAFGGIMDISEDISCPVITARSQNLRNFMQASEEKREIALSGIEILKKVSNYGSVRIESLGPLQTENVHRRFAETFILRTIAVTTAAIHQADHLCRTMK